MTSFLESNASCTSLINSVEKGGLNIGNTLTPMGGALFDNWREQSVNRQRYNQFRGWLYSAINAIASEAAGQDVEVGILKKNGKDKPKVAKATMPRHMQKAAAGGYEVLTSHPLIDAIAQPNPIQGQWQFVYSFVANLCLTGWSFVVGGQSKKGKLEFFSLPTTWVRPDHSKGPFSAFRITNPNNPAAQGELIPKENVAFANLPNPMDPMGAYAPAASQSVAIAIDDHIQTSQLQFFENGIFPSVVVTIGHDPHPSVAAGIRPRLTAAQRRQVIGAIRKTMGGVSNYGNAAIVDGLIEKIEKLSNNSNEMGWDKSEDKVRTRILSAVGVHPYILGEAVSVGGYAQVAKIEERFCKKVNTYTTMLGKVVTNFAAPMSDDKQKVVAYWEQCLPNDPSLKWQNLREARKNGDVSRDEIRAELGLPPDETGGERNRQWTAGDINAIVAIQGKVADGTMLPEQAAAVYEIAFDLSPEDSIRIAGKEVPVTKADERAEQAQQQFGQPGQPPGVGQQKPEQPPGKKPPKKPKDEVQNATDELSKALVLLQMSPIDRANQLLADATS